MMKLNYILAASAAMLTVSTSALAQQAAPTTGPATAAAETPHDRLFRLFKDSDEAQLKRNPLFWIKNNRMRTIAASSAPTRAPPRFMP